MNTFGGIFLMNFLNKYCDKLDFNSYEDFYNNFKLNVPKDFNFAYDIVDEYARLTPDKMALVWCDDKGDERFFTFAEMKRMSDKAASYLTSKGIKKGDSVMLILQRRYEYWTILLGLCKIGAVIIPATHLLTKKDIIYRVNAAEVKMIVTIDEDELCNSIIAAKKDTPTLKYITCLTDKDGFININKEIEKASDVLVCNYKKNSKDLLFLYFTSGTTGMPKMVAHIHEYALAHIITAKYWLNDFDGGLHFTLSETGWAKASWGKLFGQWLCGSGIFVYDFHGKFTPIDLLPLIEKYKVTNFCAPPTVYRFLMKEDLTKFNFSSLKHMTTAGEALNPEIFKQIKEKTGLSLYEGFGQTEVVLMLAAFVGYTDIKVGSMGKPCPLYDVFISDDDGNEVSAGEEGEICIKIKENQHGLFGGYYKDEALTNQQIHDGVYHLGDLAYKDEDGYFWFVGRKDDIIKSSGYRIGPFEVESALLEHPAVMECAITAVPDEIRGQIVKATVILSKDYTASDLLIKELQNYVKKVTAPYKYPRIIEFVDALPKTISGKIRRVEIREKNKQN
jgi:acetyl-CoA synthetase